MAESITYADPNDYTATVVIASAGTTSEALNCANRTVVGVIIPGLTGTKLSIEASMDDSTWFDLYNAAGDPIEVVYSGAGMYKLSPADLVGIEFIRFVSDAAEGSARTLSLVVARVTNDTK